MFLKRSIVDRLIFVAKIEPACSWADNRRSREAVAVSTFPESRVVPPLRLCITSVYLYLYCICAAITLRFQTSKSFLRGFFAAFPIQDWLSGEVFLELSYSRSVSGHKTFSLFSLLDSDTNPFCFIQKINNIGILCFFVLVSVFVFAFLLYLAHLTQFVPTGRNDKVSLTFYLVYIFVIVFAFASVRKDGTAALWPSLLQEDN